MTKNAVLPGERLERFATVTRGYLCRQSTAWHNCGYIQEGNRLAARGCI